MARYAYLHGFASSPLARKGVALAQRFEKHGLALERPDLRAPSFAELSVSAALQVLVDLGPGPWRVVGSSLGGYLAALWASLHPDRVERLLLLCPGFGLPDRWPSIVGTEAFERWERDGELLLPDASGGHTAVHWGFVEDARTHPAMPEVPCPTRIIHGVRDEVVPVTSSRRYAATRDHVALIEVDDIHDLGLSIDRIGDEALSFLGALDSDLR